MKLNRLLNRHNLKIKQKNEQPQSKTKNETSSEEPLRGTVEGEGTSRHSEKSKYDTSDFVDTTFKDVNSSTIDYGESYINRLLLEDKKRK